jgi:hypothetical protein
MELCNLVWWLAVLKFVITSLEFITNKGVTDMRISLLKKARLGLGIESDKGRGRTHEVLNYCSFGWLKLKPGRS